MFVESPFLRVSLQGPFIFTIAPDLPFVDVLAAGLIAMSHGEAFRLARLTVFLPSRRACLALREAFLRAAFGQAMLLPRLVPVGGINEEAILFANIARDLSPAMPPLRRQLLLTRLILGGQGAATALSPAQAAQLAAALAQFLDEVQTERLAFDQLATLVPADYASHWQVTLHFLALLTQVWPSILEAERYMDPAVWHDQVMQGFVTAWRRQPPSDPVIIAGLAHANPVLTDLVTTVASLPGGAEGRGGYIVLPGLDRTLDDESWNTLNDTHPQAGLKTLLTALNIDRRDVTDWPVPQPLVPLPRPHCDRLRLVTEALRPAASTDRWQALVPLSPQALSGIDYFECSSLQEEAKVIALLLREVLEHEGQTAALVTPDRILARRVAAELERWDVLVDDSAGVPLAQTSPGVFLRLTAALIATAFAPLPLLETLKHPLAAAAHAPGNFRRLVRRLEIEVLRGLQPATGLTGLRAILEQANPTTSSTMCTLFDWLEVVSSPFTALMQGDSDEKHSLIAFVKAHIAFSEALATSTDQPGSDRLWQCEAGVVAAELVADLLEAADVFPRLLPRFYPALLETCMENYTVRPSSGCHPRLSIWGPLEARLQHPDLLILGELNEGTWPPALDADPWMSYPMRARFGLPPPERRIGLSAHDFVHAFCAPRVILTRSRRVEGTPTVPSRWLLRLDAVLRAAGLHEMAASSWKSAQSWLRWARGLDWPRAFVTPARPMPRPPLSARPKQLSVTEIGIWIQDPYAIYAKHVLRLRALLPLNASLDAADYGTLVHKALELCLKRWPATRVGPPLEEELLAIGRELFDTAMTRAGVQQAFWWPRFRRIAHWVALREQVRRQQKGMQGVQVFPEINGRLALTRSKWSAQFFLTAKADRIELLPDNRAVIIDYKTGSIPSQRKIAIGYEPQLPLEAAMVSAGAFPGISGRRNQPVKLLYWHLTGMNGGGEERPAGNDASALAAQAITGLQALVTLFEDRNTPYAACPHPSRYSHYQHLARTKEWAAGGDDGMGQ